MTEFFIVERWIPLLNASPKVQTELWGTKNRYGENFEGMLEFACSSTTSFTEQTKEGASEVN